ncbi:MAG: HTTM domain-containing protein [Alphaproteobacteria bacterium]
MSLNLAIHLTSMLLALAFILQSLEHLHIRNAERTLFLPRLILSFLLLLGFWPKWVCLMLLVNAMFILKRFQGPYNGGSDRMGLLILFCLCLVHWVPAPQWKEYIFGYLALQLVLSYFIAGWVKVVNHDWRTGQALQDVFQFSAYPVSESLRGWAHRPTLLFVMSWSVIIFEISFPFMLLTPITLTIGLSIAALFHLANAHLFGLNRFFWIWISAYPALLWLQSRVFQYVS